MSGSGSECTSGSSWGSGSVRELVSRLERREGLAQVQSDGGCTFQSQGEEGTVEDQSHCQGQAKGGDKS